MSKNISQERLLKDVCRVLDNRAFFPIESGSFRQVVRNGCGGEFDEDVNVIVSPFGHICLTTDGNQRRVRILEEYGFSVEKQSLRVRNALKILALAIWLDNEDHPQVAKDSSL